MRSTLSSATRTLLQSWLGNWLVGDMGENVERAGFVVTGLDLEIPSGRIDWGYGQILEYIAKGDEELLDAVHVTLGVIRTEGTTSRNPPYREVDPILAIGRSALMATENGLVHRADPTGQKAFEMATATPGSASTELAEAWTQAHTRNSSPGAAWGHSIKAVEAALIPIVGVAAAYGTPEGSGRAGSGDDDRVAVADAPPLGSHDLRSARLLREVSRSE
jgi:hypothetical protein